MLTRRTIIATKMEGGNYGIDAVCAAADCFLAYNVSVKPEIDTLERAPHNDSLGMLEPQKGARRCQVTFTTDIYGSGTAGTVPVIDTLFRACGFAPTTEATIQVLYEPKDPTTASPFESITIAVWEDGIKNVLTGCRGNFAITSDMGQRGKIDWTFEAMDFTHIDEDPPEGIYSSVVPPVCLNQNFSVESYAAIIPSLAINVNNTISRAPSVNVSGGYARVDITNRAVTGSIAPEAVTLVTHPFYTKWAAGTKSGLAITIGSVAGNIIKISAPRVHYTGLSLGDRAGIIAMTLPFVCAEMVATVSGQFDATTTAAIAKDTSLFTIDDEYNGGRITIPSGTLAGKARIITDTNGAAGTATLEAAFGSVPGTGTYFGISKKEIQILFK